MLIFAIACINTITAELKAEIEKLAIANGCRATAAIRPAPTPATAQAGTIAQILKSLTGVFFKNVNLSVNADFWDWGGEDPPQPRYLGKPTSWVSETDGEEVLRVKWELGRDDDGNPQLDANDKPKYAATAAAVYATEKFEL